MSSILSPGTSRLFVKSQLFISRRLGTLALNGLWRLVRFWALPGVSDEDQAAAAIFPSYMNDLFFHLGQEADGPLSLTNAGTKTQISCLAAGFPLTKVALDQGSQSCCKELLWRVVPICGSHSMWLHWGLGREWGICECRENRFYGRQMTSC